MPEHGAFTSDDAIVAIGRGLFDRTLPKREWTHAAHFAAALWVIVRRPELDATVELPVAIRRYNEATGVANTETAGYHETITQASILAARAFVTASAALPLFETANALLSSPLGDAGWLLQYWSRAALFSREARREWLDADIGYFPYS